MMAQGREKEGGNEVSLVAKTNNQLGDGSMYVCISSVYCGEEGHT